MESESLSPTPAVASAGSAVHPRVWPVVAILALQLAVMFGTSWLAPETVIHFFGLMFAPIVGALLLLLWWLFASRVPWRGRLAGTLVAVAAVAACALLAHESLVVALMVYGLTSLSAVVAVVLLVTSAVAWPSRRWLLAAGVVGVCAFWSTLRLDGLDGDFVPELAFRWSSTAEEEFLVEVDASETRGSEARSGAVITAVPLAASADWPGFRGPGRDGKLRGVTFATQWNERPPRELWRRRVGPGWSSFAIVGLLAFTQEQRGPQELVVCYRLEDGEEVWVNRVATRFEETVGGPGPRATPTYDRGKLFAMGATGVLQCLDPATGKAIWKGDLRTDVGASVPTWGFSSSPLVLGDLVVVFSGADGGKSVVAYDRDSGKVLWTGGDGKLSYSSCHLAQISDVDQILMFTEVGLQSLDLASGTQLWEHRWEIEELNRVVQPLVLEGGSVLLGTGFGLGTRRVAVTRSDDQWRAEENWTSRALKPYFNDFVLHEGHCYGFDARIFACIEVEHGRRRWKGGRYGHGQVLLVADMETLLVVSERGEVALVEASPEGHRELARFQALSGKTWNHPVIAQGRLLVRNGTEMACFELPR